MGPGYGKGFDLSGLIYFGVIGMITVAVLGLGAIGTVIYFAVKGAVGS